MRLALLALLVVAGAAACVLPAGSPCCAQDVDCLDGTRCFQGRCSLRCDDDSQCNDGETCRAPSGVCTPADPDDTTLAACPYLGGAR